MARAGTQPNERFRTARARLRLSRQQLADEANHSLPRLRCLNANDIGKIERGEVTWPGTVRRAAFRRVLRAATDNELGFVNSRALFDEAEAAGGGYQLPAMQLDSLLVGRVEEVTALDGDESLVAFTVGGPIAGPWLVLLNNLASLAETLGWNAVRPLAAKTTSHLGLLLVNRFSLAARR